MINKLENAGYPLSMAMMDGTPHNIFNEDEEVGYYFESRGGWSNFEQWLRKNYCFWTRVVEGEDVVVSKFIYNNRNFWIAKDCGTTAVHAAPEILKQLLADFDKR